MADIEMAAAVKKLQRSTQRQRITDQLLARYFVGPDLDPEREAANDAEISHLRDALTAFDKEE